MFFLNGEIAFLVDLVVFLELVLLILFVLMGAVLTVAVLVVLEV
jgi:hypothetical protein